MVSDSWSSLLREFEELSDNAKSRWINCKLDESLLEISKIRNSNVIFYASDFLQRPALPAIPTQIMPEDMNGFMSAIHELDDKKKLTLILHTPGGSVNAAEAIVGYLHNKFTEIEVAVPVYAFSAGTMIALSSHRIIMGRQSQIGPIDPQIPIGNKTTSAVAIIRQFEQARRDINENTNYAHLWAATLHSLAPSLLSEAEFALMYSHRMVAKRLKKGMCKNAPEKADDIASFFSRLPKKDSEQREDSNLQDHGQRIDRHTAKEQGLNIETMEDDQKFQNAILKAYHVITIMFETSSYSKIVANHIGNKWMKHRPIQQR